jgi:hypothetical protein
MQRAGGTDRRMQSFRPSLGPQHGHVEKRARHPSLRWGPRAGALERCCCTAAPGEEDEGKDCDRTRLRPCRVPVAHRHACAAPNPGRQRQPRRWRGRFSSPTGLHRARSGAVWRRRTRSAPFAPTTATSCPDSQGSLLRASPRLAVSSAWTLMLLQSDPCCSPTPTHFPGMSRYTARRLPGAHSLQWVRMAAPITGLCRRGDGPAGYK